MDVRVTPWRDEEELLLVRALFYPPRPERHPSRRRRACERVAVWQARGPALPHAVIATAALTDACLTDEAANTAANVSAAATPSHAEDAGEGFGAEFPRPDDWQLALAPVSTLTRRGAYATAVAQFVTGITDTAQDRAAKKSMYDVAREVGLPASLIEVRHRIAHEGTPGLPELRHFAAEALAWLREGYWRELTPGGAAWREGRGWGDGVGESGWRERRCRATCEQVLEEFVQKSEEESAKRHLWEADASAELARACRNEVPRLQILSEVLLSPEFLIDPGLMYVGPAFIRSQAYGLRLNEGLFGERLDRWDGLLKQCALHQRTFLLTLTDDMMLRIVRPPGSSLSQGGLSEKDGKRRSASRWLGHIYNSKSWAEIRSHSGIDPASAVKACLAAPGFWTLHLAQEILENHGELYDRYETEAADIGRAMEEDAVPEPRVYQASEAAQALCDAWEKGEGDGLAWVPKPIGMAGLTAQPYIETHSVDDPWQIS